MGEVGGAARGEVLAPGVLIAGRYRLDDVAVRSIGPAGRLALAGSPEAALPSSGLTTTALHQLE